MPRLRTPATFARYAVAGAAAAAVALAAAPAQAAEPVINSGSVGGYTDTTCGWTPQDVSLFDLAPRKVVRVNLPSVSGTFAGQLVWAHVRFTQLDPNGSPVDYRTGWVYTYASPGQLTNVWTTYAAGTSGSAYLPAGTSVNYLEDAPGESGFASGDSQNPVTEVFVRLYWMTGSTTTGMADEIGQNASNVEYPRVCNGGGTLF